MTEYGYLRALLDAKGIGISRALELYKHFGSATEVFAQRHSLPVLVRNALIPSEDTLRQAEAEEAFCAKNNIRILTYNDADYPQRLCECADAPLLLYYKGVADLNVKHIVAVVGTRRITERGKDTVQAFCRELAGLLPDVLIVSGLAYGVDIHAHRAALQFGMDTVGVLAHGLDRIYPSYHRPVAVEMVSHGGLLTEYPSGTTPHAGHFVSRNRIVAGMSDAVVVVESAAKGGALITAHLAQEYNRDVFAFPGRINDEMSAGCNNLIKHNAAALITEATDLTENMLWTNTESDRKIIQPNLFPELSAEEKLLVECLSEAEQKTISELSQQTGLAFSKTMASLLALELKGIVKGLPGGIYRLQV
ncbi:MAG: DNA-processing protein DprA [Alloprevotella sp.]|nr:DNA-processing protein DprA [Alloprevotella sp.]